MWLMVLLLLLAGLIVIFASGCRSVVRHAALFYGCLLPQAFDS